MTVVIVGGGISGLTLARCLLKRRISFRLLEKTPPAKWPRGQQHAITLHAWSYEPLLKELDMSLASFKEATAIEGAPGLARDGSLRVHRGKLDKFLLSALPAAQIELDAAVSSVSLPSSTASKPEIGVKYTTTGPEEEKYLEATAVVAADGVHSAVRNSLVQSYNLKVLPVVAFNGKRSLKDAPPSLITRLQDSLTGELAHTVKDTTVSISLTTPDLVNYVFTRPARNENDPLHRPDRSKESATDTPAELYDELDSLQPDLDADFAWVFDTSKVRSERVLHWLMRTGSAQDPEELVALADKGVILLGDAAHARPIIGGYGANEAILDALTLASGWDDKKAYVQSRLPGWEKRWAEVEDSYKSHL